MKPFLVALLLLMAAPVLVGTLGTRAAGAEDAVSVSVAAIRATHEDREGKVFDRELSRDVREAVEHLAYDTFRRLKQTRVTAAYSEETAIPITEDYTLYVTPLSTESRGRVRIETRLEKHLTRSGEDGDGGKKKRTMNALKTTSAVVPGDKLCFGGFSLDRGDLLLVLTVSEAGR